MSWKFTSPEEFDKMMGEEQEIDLENLNNSSNYDINGNKQQLVKVKKNLVLYIFSDASGCSFIRGMQPMMYMYFVFGKLDSLIPICLPTFTFDEKILMRTRSIVFQRTMSPNHVQIINRYKELQSRFKYKMIWDMDDFIWWEDDNRTQNGVPKYNLGHINIDDNVRYSSIQIMKQMDLITTSTKYLSDYITNTLKVDVPKKVIPNVVMESLWGDRWKGGIKKPIEKPRIIYTGSPTHYANTNPYVGELLGDWENAWKEYIIKNVKDNKIDFICMGGLPFFFNEISSKIKVFEWEYPFRYHLRVKGQQADFGIMPLVPNRFNYSKSDLKFIEYSIAGIVGIGTTFDNGFPSPYDDMPVKLNYKCNVRDIEDTIKNLCNPENYNKILQIQYSKLRNDSRILESNGYIEQWTSIL